MRTSKGSEIPSRNTLLSSFLAIFSFSSSFWSVFLTFEKLLKYKVKTWWRHNDVIGHDRKMKRELPSTNSSLVGSRPNNPSKVSRIFKKILFLDKNLREKSCARGQPNFVAFHEFWPYLKATKFGRGLYWKFGSLKRWYCCWNGHYYLYIAFSSQLCR